MKTFALKTCKICGKSSPTISTVISICARCLRERFDLAGSIIEEVHGRIRKRYGLPQSPPNETSGLKCTECGNACNIPEGGLGLCGLVKNISGRLERKFGTPECGLLSWYYDPIPTNCVPAEFCAGSGGAGYPKWCRTPLGDIGMNNLSVFLGSCTYNCLFCQNFGFRELTASGGPVLSAGGLAEKVDSNTGCVCYFGGDPSSQMPFVIASAGLIREKSEEENRVIRICLETNLSIAPPYLNEIAEISLESGGGIKADIKCWSPEILYALCGVKTKLPYENLKRIGGLHRKRPEVPFARASTLLVPGYVDDEEIRSIASFIADIDVTIPYSLLSFHPTYFMEDMPYTRREDAERYLKICRREGLEKVRIGNPWLLR